ncbi:hypothetical protein Tco_0808815 [Tanacetum coccineum]
MNGWIEWDEPVGNPEEDSDMYMSDDEEGEEEEEWEEYEDWLMAPVTHARATVFPGSTYEVGGPSTTAPEPPFPMGRPFSVVADSVVVHHEEIGGLGYRVENLEHAHGTLVRKIWEVSDAQVDDIIAIREIQPKVTTLEGRVEVLGNQHDLIVKKIVEVEDQVLKIQDREDNHPCKQVLGLSQQVQTLKTTLQ